MSLLSRVSAFATRHHLWRSDTRVIAAVSGGSDSVALLLLLQALQRRSELVLDCLAHLHHGIRGADADADEAFCAAVAARLGVAFVAERVDVPAMALRQGLSIEVAARNTRRDFLERVRTARGAERIATAHTSDDQAETVLLRLLRGSGTRGLGGMAPMRGVWIRPLLDVTHEELRDELRRRGQPWREDRTNDDLGNPRNRVRHELIPLLEREFNPSLRQALGRLADLSRADEATLHSQAVAAAASLLTADHVGRVAIDASGLSELPVAVARRVVRLAAERALGDVSPRLEDVDAVRAVAAGARASARICTLDVEPSARFVVLVPRGLVRPAPVSFRLDLPIPGVVHLPAAGWTLEAEGPIRRLTDDVRPRAADRVHVEAAELGAGLVVRSRQPGDRLRPLGVGGRKKVQDVLVDRKVPRGDRDSVPIVTDRNGRIVWVAGHVLAEEFRVSEGTNTVVILKLRRA